MTQIEHHQAHIRRIRARHRKIGNSPNEDVTKSPEAHHIIGKSQNFPENIYLFLEKNRNDPAVKVAFCLSLLTPIDAVCQNFLPKLKDHILPRIKEVLQIHNGTSDMDASVYRANRVVPEGSDADHNPVFFKSDCMYRHHLARFNYTTYDIRRSQDVINPDTSHCDIMMLSNNNESDSNSKHPFLYARVLGIYHVNVIYFGEGNQDHTARRIDFLWVRWYEYDGAISTGWQDMKLDLLYFLPVATEGAFGFVNPADVLRGCHIISSFTKGKAHLDGIGLSKLAHDAQDWSHYRVNQYLHPI